MIVSIKNALNQQTNFNYLKRWFMSYDQIINEALSRFTPDQLSQRYINTSFAKEDQVPETLEEHIRQSEDWNLQAGFGSSCDSRSPSSVDDIMDVIEIDLVLVDVDEKI